MHRTLWTQDPHQVSRTLIRLVDSRRSLIAKTTDQPGVKLYPKRVHIRNGRPFLLLRYNGDELLTAAPYSAFFKLPGQPIIEFALRIAYRQPHILAIRFPTRLYQVQLRREPRFIPSTGSIATFQHGAQDRLNLCRVLDISANGARLEGAPLSPLNKRQQISSCTLSLSEYEALVVKEMTVQRATVAWLTPADKQGQITFGVNFLANDRETEQLAGQLHYLTKVAASPFPPLASPFTS